MNDFKAALFDLDGTLINTEPCSRWAWKKLFATYGVRLAEDELGTFSGRRGQEVLAERLHRFPGGTVDGLFEEAMSYWDTPDAPSPVPVPGAVELVRKIADASVPAAIVSSARRVDVHNAVGTLGLHGVFTAIVAAEDVAEGKPNPEGVLRACGLLDADPARTIMFEDAPAGIAAAKRAGVACVAVTTTRAGDALTEADRVVEDLHGIEWPPELRVRRGKG